MTFSNFGFPQSPYLLVTLIVLSATAFEVVKTHDDVGHPGICGKVQTKQGHVISLKEGEILSEMEFDKVQIMKLDNATFSPVVEGHCVIQVCGFTSYTAPVNPNECVGSFSDLMDCLTIKNSETKKLAFNDRFNASSLACGCYKEYSLLGMACEAKCQYKKEFLDTNKSAWKGNECAVLFRERDCLDCHFSAFKLETGTEFVTDKTTHINSVIVRDQCTVSVRVPALKRLCSFRNSSGLFEYTSDQKRATSFTPASAYQSDPEVYTCTCSGEETRGTTTPSDFPIQTEAKDENGNDNCDCSPSNAIQYMTLIIAGMILLLVIMGVRIGRKHMNRINYTNNCTTSLEKQSINHMGVDEVRYASKV